MKNRCLVIVDVQKCFCPGGNLPVNYNKYEVWKMINKINQLIKLNKENSETNRTEWYFNHIVYTQDAHPKNHNSFVNNNLGKDAIGDKQVVPWKYDKCQRIKRNGKTEFLWPDHAVNDGSDDFGIDFHPDLDTSPLKRPKIFDDSVYLTKPVRDGRGRIIWKGQDKEEDQYSGFLPTTTVYSKKSPRKVSILEKFLRDNNVEEVYFCGLVREVCVWRTSIKNLDGIEKYFVWDCTLPIGIPFQCVTHNSEYKKASELEENEVELHNKVLEEMLKNNYMEVIYSYLTKEGDENNLWYQVYLKPYNVKVCNSKDLNF